MAMTDRSFTGSLAGRCAVVTGGAQGIGLAIARRLLAEGVRVAITDIDARALEQAAGQLAEWVAAGSLHARVHELEGIERAPEALVRLFSGEHLGKLIVRL